MLSLCGAGTGKDIQCPSRLNLQEVCPGAASLDLIRELKLRLDDLGLVRENEEVVDGSY